MVLRCSLLGHDYGDSDVEREREERGSEVVVTVREYEECTRCSDRHVISENTEVRSLSTATGVDSRPDESEPTPAREPASEPDGPDGTDATFIDADETEPGAATGEASPPEVDTLEVDAPADDLEIPTDENGDPVTDDGEILEDDGTTPRDREHGEWPDSDDVGPPVDAERGPTEWPDDESEPIENDGAELIENGESEPAENDDAELIENDDAVLLDTGTTDDAAATTVETEPAPEAAAGGPPSAEETSTGPGSGIERAGSAPTPGSEGGTPADDSPSELYCPRCEFVAGSDRSSLRTGDICPDCRKGYLGERGSQ
ncbi:hypothetical protein CV102_11280 [Natronococcus pandeyae]|uniref:Uncharacterized protein n=1 Tax=Natronococcus pandeyae TaxID=2055836 RepID=A0A8J8Q3U7_9EURY|nr:hypothetical protein [Natronococcus pandeyae]TYL38389.1 hypothetical protein CV102_11280 [Natronococcus pandeyae]